MKAIVNMAWLAERVRENRSRHRALFLEAQEGFRAKAIEELEKRLATLRAGKVPQLFVHLTGPTDQTADYDRILAMLDAMKVTGAEVIELSEDDFAKYVLDQWHWKREWISNSAAYRKTKLVEDEE